MLKDFLRDKISEAEQSGLYRKLKHVEGAQGRRIKIDGREVLNFSSNNYLGLADDPRLKTAVTECVSRQGFGSGASRLICGDMEAHQALEKKIANFKGSEACVVFSTGYMANTGIISSLFDRGDIIFSDKLNHASIIDGILLSGAKFKRYPHKDVVALEKMLKESKDFLKKVIITDSVFSMDGDIAPLDQIVSLAKKYKCSVMVDEAHAFGVLGAKGTGAVEYFGLEKDIDIQMGTLSKAVGSFGAYCCGSKDLISFIINKARSFIYTTGMPPSTAAASSCAIDIIQQEPERRSRLWKNTRYIREGLQAMGFDAMDSETPIIPILIGDNKKTLEFSKKLFEQGIFVSAIRPPTIPRDTARLRLTVMSTHQEDDLDFVIEQFKDIGKELCLI